MCLQPAAKPRTCWAEKEDLPRNTGARFIYAYQLIDLKGMLDDQLKKRKKNWNSLATA